MKVRGVKLYMFPYSCLIFFIRRDRFPLEQMAPILGMWHSFWNAFARLNSPSEGL